MQITLSNITVLKILIVGFLILPTQLFAGENYSGGLKDLSNVSTYDCQTTDNKGCQVDGGTTSKLRTEYSYSGQRFTYCDYLSVSSGLRIFIPGKTWQEYSSFRNWVSQQDPSKISLQACTTPSWSAWSACSAACGGGTQTRTCLLSQYSDGNCSSIDGGNSTQACNTQSCTQVIATSSSPNGNVLCGGQSTEITMGPYGQLVQFDVDMWSEDFNYEYRIDDGPLVTNLFCSGTYLVPTKDEPDGGIQHLKFVTAPAHKIWVRVTEGGKSKYCDYAGFNINVITGTPAVPVVPDYGVGGYVFPRNADPSCPYVPSECELTNSCEPWGGGGH